MSVTSCNFVTLSTNTKSLFVQDEKYIHIDEMEMMKVEKCVSEVIEWMNNAVSAQAKKSLDQDPAVRSFEIKAKLQVNIKRN